MIEVESALELIERYFVKIEKERVSLNHLVGRILAMPIKAKRDQPPFDRVAMDGIAVSFHGNSSKSYRIEGVQKAGQPQKELNQKYNAIEVMTGSVLPLGTDTVIPYENLCIEDSTATLKKGYELVGRKNIHFLGSDYSSDQTLLNTGTKLTSAAVALIAGQGDNEAVVSRLPKVAVISTGDELVEPGQKCLNWQIWRF